MSGMRALVVGVLTVAVLAAVGGTTPAPASGRHLLLVSIAGLRPDFYLDDGFPAPELRALRAAGSHARVAEPVFPTTSYPGHATIVTGVRPARHGVLFDLRFMPEARDPWYDDAAALRAPALWQWARGAGLTTAAIDWPSTVGASIDLLVPGREYAVLREPLVRLRAGATPGLLERLDVLPGAEAVGDPERWDAFVAAAAAAVIRDARPHLALVRFSGVARVQRRLGRDAPEVRAALGRVDAHVGSLVRALGDAVGGRAAVIVTGDHGYQEARVLVNPNEVLARAGLRDCPEPGDRWRATAHVAGGAAAVYVNPPHDDEARATAESALRAAAGARYGVLPRVQLDELGAMPGAALGLEAARRYVLGPGCGEGLTGRAMGAAGGFLPTRPHMATGFVAAGDGIRAGVTLPRVRLIDVAPTAARLLGVAAPAVEGRTLDELLE